MKFRQLEASEIEVRVSQVFDTGCTVLLYKDARCDMNILDKTVGLMGWKREHSRDNANCTVSIWDNENNQWVGKEDTGKQSNTEKEKGQASDSFKRSCFNWGIGRELYTAPSFMWINLEKVEMYKNKNGKLALDNKVKFQVYHISYNGNKIDEIGICDQNRNKRYRWKFKELKPK